MKFNKLLRGWPREFGDEMDFGIYTGLNDKLDSQLSEAIWRKIKQELPEGLNTKFELFKEELIQIQKRKIETGGMAY